MNRRKEDYQFILGIGIIIGFVIATGVIVVVDKLSEQTDPIKPTEGKDDFKEDFGNKIFALSKQPSVLVAFASLLILFLIFMFAIKSRSNRRCKKQIQTNCNSNSSDNAQPIVTTEQLNEFSAENLCDTKLDLATAYIALKRYNEAKKLLETVILTGDAKQAAQAKSLIESIENNCE